MAQVKHYHCYLCGEVLSDPINRDHCPPRRFFAPEIRKTYNATALITFPTHVACNERWRLDEEYFVYTFLPFVKGSVSGNALYWDFIKRVEKGDNVKLANRVLNEFQHFIGGIILPANRIAKKFDSQRVHDVIYKIIRGLHYHHHGEILPSVRSCYFTVTPPNEPPPEAFLAVAQSGWFNPQGRYQDVFAYTFAKFSEVNNLHYWAMLLWDQIIITAAFHDPACECDDCRFVGPPKQLRGDRLSQ